MESANVHPDNVVLLANKGYLPASLQRVLSVFPAIPAVIRLGRNGGNRRR